MAANTKTPVLSTLDTNGQAGIEAFEDIQKILAKLGKARTRLALEQRLVFDAAAAATGAEVAADLVAQDQAETAAESLTDNSSPEQESGDSSDAVSITGQNALSGDVDNSGHTAALSLALSDEAEEAGDISLSLEPTEVLFIDGSVPNVNDLLSAIPPSVEVFILDPNLDGVEQIASALEGRTGIDAIHIISHGDSAQLNLGSATLTTESMRGEHADELATIGAALSDHGDILVYGCNFGEGDQGKYATDLLAELTGADVASSDDLTGSAELGGDWDLEVLAGEVEAKAIVVGNWDNTLAVDAATGIANLPDGQVRGEEFSFSVTVDNTGTPGEIGYFPFVDVWLPEGMAPPSAVHEGIVMTAETVIHYNGSGDPTPADHPFVNADGLPALPTGNGENGTPDYGYMTLYVFELPIIEQTGVDIESVSFTTSLIVGDTSNTYGTEKTIRAASGFQTDVIAANRATLHYSSITQDIVTVQPATIELESFPDDGEDENSTGPSHPFNYQLTVNLEENVQFDGLQINNELPNNLVYNPDTVRFNGAAFVDVNGVLTATANGITITMMDEPVRTNDPLVEVGQPNNAPDNNFIFIVADNSNGTANAEDIVITYQVYIPEIDANGAHILPETSGENVGRGGEDATAIINQASLSGDVDYTPLDNNDNDVYHFDIGLDNDGLVDNEDGSDDTIYAKALATQKGVSLAGYETVDGVNVLTEPTDAIPSPGDLLEWSIEFQVSDYYELSNVVITDTFSDGHNFFGPVQGGAVGAGIAPSFTIFENGVQTAIVPIPANFYTITEHNGPGEDGSATIVFNFHNFTAEEKAGFTEEERIVAEQFNTLTGDLFSDGDTSGETVVNITFYTQIQENYDVDQISDDASNNGVGDSIDIGDVFSNQVTVSGTITHRDAAGDNFAVADTSSASIQVAPDNIDKSITAVNGGAISTTVEVGDTVTYHIQVTIPFSDAEEFHIRDYGDFANLDLVGLAFVEGENNNPAVGTITLGTSFDLDDHVDQGFKDQVRNPTVIVNEASGFFELDFGTFEQTGPNQSSVIDLYYTVAVRDNAVASGTHVINEAWAVGRTSQGTSWQDRATAVSLDRESPNLQIHQGVVGFSPVIPDIANRGDTALVNTAGVDVNSSVTSWANPGTGANEAAFTGSVDSYLDVDANLDDAVAGDLVRMAIIVENTGSDDAWDVTLNNDIPAGLERPGNNDASYNLRVTDGNGNVLLDAGGNPFTAADFFNGGITLAEGVNGAVGNGDDGDNSQIIVITYDLKVTGTVEGEPGDNTDYVPTATILTAAAVNDVNAQSSAVYGAGRSDSAGVTVDTVPVAVDDFRGAQDHHINNGIVTVTVISGDADNAGIGADTNGQNDEINLYANADAVNGETVGSTLTIPNEGTWVANNDGTVTFTPGPNFIGDPTPIYYTVGDAQDETSNRAKITVEYKPVAVNDIEKSFAPGAVVTLNVVADILDNDTQNEGDVAATFNLVGGTRTDNGDDYQIELAVANEGIWLYTYDATTPANNTLVFTPGTDINGDPFVGEPTPVNYTIRDSDTAIDANGNLSNEATIRINIIPVAQNDGEGIRIPIITEQETIIDVLANDGDANVDGGNLGDGLTITQIIDPVTGVAVNIVEYVDDGDDNDIITLTSGTDIKLVDGKLVVTPNGKGADLEQFDYVVRDQHGATSQATVFMALDSDGDGVVNVDDIDDDNDGILDVVEMANAGRGNDSDNDGFADHRDIDADNDGITDNVEAQTTAGYIAPSGEGDPNNGGNFIDVNRDGLDDNFDAGIIAAIEAGQDTANAHTGVGFTPVNSDDQGVALGAANGRDDTPDYLDDDSDNDGKDDVFEAGHGLTQAQIDANRNDTDGDGLLDIFEGADTADHFDVNDENIDGDNGGVDGSFTGFGLPDSDNDLAADGSDANVLINDMDFRENSSPVPIIANPIFPVNEDATSAGQVLPVLANFADVDTAANNIVITTLNGGNSNVMSGVQVVGTVTLDADGKVVFTQTLEHFNGSVTFTYVVGDGFAPVEDSVLTATINILPVNDAPEGTDKLHIAINEDAPFTFGAADFGFSDPVEGHGFEAVIITTLPPVAEGVLTLNGVAVAANQEIPVANIPNLVFTPAQDVNDLNIVNPEGLGLFTFQVVDNGGTDNGGQDTDQSPNTISFNIAPMHDEGSITGLTDGPDNGTNAEGNAIQTDGAVEESSLDADVGQDAGTDSGETKDIISAGSFTITAIDGIESLQIGDTTFTLAQLQATTATPVVVAGTSYGTLTITGFNAGVVSYSYALTEDVDHTAGPINETVNLSLTDNDTGEVVDGVTAPTTGTLVIAIIDDAPKAENDTNSVTEDTVLVASGNVITPVAVGDVADNFGADGQAALPVTGVSFGNVDGVVGGNVVGTYGTLVLNNGGTYDYTLNNDSAVVQGLAQGVEVTDVFTYQITDNDGDTSTATLTITVTGSNDAPVAENDTLSTDENTVLNGFVFVANDNNLDNGGGGIDRDIDGDSITVVKVGSADGNVGNAVAGSTGGTFVINENGSFSFDPGEDFQNLPVGGHRLTTVTYLISDGKGGTDEATVTVRVNGNNDAPVAVDDGPIIVVPGVAENIDVLTYGVDDSDIDGDTITVTGIVDPANTGVVIPMGADSTFILQSGTVVTLLADGTFDVTQAPGADGTELFDYQITDEHGLTATATVTLLTDTDSDGVANIDDIDDDNDGILDVDEGFSLESGYVLTDSVDLGDGVITDVDGGNIVLSNQENFITQQNGSTNLPSAGVFVNGYDTASTQGGFNYNYNTPVNFQVDSELVIIADYYDAIPNGAGDVNNYVSMPITIHTTQGDLTTTYVFSEAEKVKLANNEWIQLEIRVPTTGTLVEVTGYEIKIETYSGGVARGGGFNPDVSEVYAMNIVAVQSDLTTSSVELDTDNDGIADHLDIDKDDDGITDNIEAQTTAGYIAPSGQGAAMVDANNDGLDDNYDAGLIAGGVATGVGLTQVDTDGDGTVDTLDSDSDNDDITDAQEAGHGVSQADIDASGDADHDGLKDIVEGANNNDGFDVNDENIAANGEFNLDRVNSLLADGSNAIPLTRDLEFRDLNDAPTTTGIVDRDGVDAQTLTADPNSIEAFSIAGSFSDIEGDALIFSATGLPTGLTMNADGLISGTIDNSASTHGPFLVTVTAEDSNPNDVNGKSVTTQFIYTITNPVPTAVDDSGSTDEDTAITVDAAHGVILPNDIDPDGDDLNVIEVNGNVTLVGAAVTGDNGGTFTLRPDGSYDFDPGNAFQDLGIDDQGATETRETSIYYTVSDGEGGTAIAQLTITVDGVNDIPVTTGPLGVRNDVDGEPIAPLDVTTAFVIPDGVTLTYSADNLPGGLSINSITGEVTGTPDADASVGGPYTVTVSGTTPEGVVYSTDMVWNVANPGPVATDDIASTPMDTPVSFTVIGNDTDPDGDDLHIDSVTQPAHGTIILNPDGTITYTPDAGFTGTEIVTYIVSDGQNGTDEGQITIKVGSVAPGTPAVDVPLPDLLNEDAQNVTLNVSTNFSDPDGQPLTYTASDLPPGLTIVPGTGLITGSIDHEASVGGPYNVTVTATDPDGHLVSETFVWTVTNPDPVAENDSLTTPLNTEISFNVLSNDHDTDGDVLFVENVTQPPLNPVTGLQETGTVTVSADGSITFVPVVDFTGVAVFTYTVTDHNGGTDTATVTITVGDAAPGVPVISATPLDSLGNLDGDTININIASGFDDPDGDDNLLTFAVTDLPPGLTLDPDTGAITGQLTPDASQSGPYDVTVTAVDPDGNQVSTTFVWTVDNPVPVAVDDSVVTAPDTPVTINVLENDTDPDGDPLSVTAVTDPAHGSVTINPDGTVTYTPDPGYEGPDSFVYTVSDGNRGETTATVSVDVDPAAVVVITPNNLPDLNSLDYENIVPFSVATAFETQDGSDNLTYSVSNLPEGLVFDPATGNVSGQLTSNASVSGPYTVVVTATDTSGTSATISFVWDVANPAPIAVDDSLTVDENEVFTGDLTPGTAGQDRDPDEDVLTVQAINGDVTAIGKPVAGSTGGVFIVNRDGSYSFDPGTDFDYLAAGEVGISTLEYTISDGEGGFDTAIVTATIRGVNDAPHIIDPNNPDVPPSNPNSIIPPQSGVDNVPVSPIDVSSYFGDPDNGEVLTFTAQGLPEGLVIDPVTGIITGTPDSHASVGGPYTVVITATDTHDASVSTNMVYLVENPAPITITDFAVVDEDSSVTGDVSVNDTDPDGDVMSFIVGTDPTHGIVTMNPDGSFIYTPNSNYNGPDSFTYTAIDADGSSVTETVHITVIPVNDKPVAIVNLNDQENTVQDNVSLDISGNFSDLEGNNLTFTETGLPDGLSIDYFTGVITGTVSPEALAEGIFEVTIIVSDGQGGVVSVGFIWDINPTSYVADDIREQMHDYDEEELDDIEIMEYDAEGIIVNTVNDVKSLGGIPLETRNIRNLFSSIQQETGRLTDSWDVRGLTGFSLRMSAGDADGETGLSGSDKGQVIVETLVRERTIYIEVKNTLRFEDDRSVTGYHVTMADGRPLPSWLRYTGNGLLIGERPVHSEVIQLKVTANVSDGSTVDKAVTIQTRNGEIQTAQLIKGNLENIDQVESEVKKVLESQD